MQFQSNQEIFMRTSKLKKLTECENTSLAKENRVTTRPHFAFAVSCAIAGFLYRMRYVLTLNSGSTKQIEKR